MNTAQTTKNLAQNIAKQVAQEPLEILKKVPEQLIGTPENLGPYENTTAPSQEKSQKEGIEELGERDKLLGARRVEALNRELKDITNQKVVKELQAKISRGEDVYLENFPELSLEQKQVLKAQQEAYQIQNSKLKIENSNIPEPSAKRGRKLFGFGQKGNIEKQQTHVERVQPPSG